MPEGDTILRAARALGRRLEGERVTAASSTIPALRIDTVIGKTIQRVEARGKNLFVHFDDGRALHTHMRMRGSWHLYAPGERWQRPQHLARVVLETEKTVAVCFQAPIVEMTASAAPPRSVKRLGPDILAPDFDAKDVIARMRKHPDMPIGEALLAQFLVAGIGNIYKSESLFLEKQDPFTKLADLDDDRLATLLARARKIMSANLAPAAARRTNASAGGAYHVYYRSGEACPRCGTVIRMKRQGLGSRSTYYCPSCQAPPTKPS